MRTVKMWRYADFEASLGSEFELDHKGERIVLRLAEVVPAQRSETSESFSVLFTSEVGRLEQGTYRVSNSTLGDQSMFLVPVGPHADNPDVFAYESVFDLRL
jgi:hypothetical protein